MADTLPPAKRARHNYDLSNTFDVLVGKEPNQQRFTVHHDLLVQRSEFFKAARSSSWTEPDQPTTLVEYDPDTFSTYLHCLYFGADAIKDRLSLITEQHGVTTEGAVNTDQRDTPAIGTETDAEKSVNNFDGTSTRGEGHNEQQNTEDTSQKPPKAFNILVNGEEKEATSTLYVGNLSWATKEKTLEQAFVESGGLRGVRIITSSKNGRSRGYGYVEFSSPESAAKALLARPDLKLDGRSLRLDFSKPRPGTASVPNQDQQRELLQHQTDVESQVVSDAVADGDINGENTNKRVEFGVSTINYITDYNEEMDDMDDAGTRLLVKLYVLSDKLIDLHTANLVIDELISHTNTLKCLPGNGFLNIVYECTPTGSPLRALFRDWYIHEGRFTWYYQKDFDVPVEFLQDLIVETGRIQREHRDETINEVFRIKAISRPIGHYHQKSGAS